MYVLILCSLNIYPGQDFSYMHSLGRYDALASYYMHQQRSSFWVVEFTFFFFFLIQLVT